MACEAALGTIGEEEIKGEVGWGQEGSIEKNQH